MKVNKHVKTIDKAIKDALKDKEVDIYHKFYLFHGLVEISNTIIDELESDIKEYENEKFSKELSDKKNTETSKDSRTLRKRKSSNN